ncbi:glycosyltransferase [Paenibacillus sp. JX-17]|uniref:Glycosyltransferase n=1 Tax=Paenibacillus lacisoli TaxID=3064525 RepID=A0ABT9CD41_9BACL|nr:glycosyltransferase [Paenibacillus sp. JX-17]MDO7907187.1 glycosyltransferase [Paenibacillus sp. JX-17]
MRKKRILLLSEGFGTGHTRAAYGLAEGMKKLYPDIQTRVIELGNFLNPTVGPLILSAYRKTVSVQPRLVGMLYRKQYSKSLNGLTQLALHRIFYTHAAQVIRQLRPDVIICTHPFPNVVVSRLKRHGLEVPLYTLITDYDAHGTWINPEVNQYLVSTPKVSSLLRSRGVHSDRIQVTGIPVHPEFWESCDPGEIRRQFSLKAMPTALIMGGGWGLLFKEEIMNKIAAWSDKIQLIFCMGSNVKLVQKLQDNPRFRHPNIHILGYTPEISKLMDVSDLLVTKPGGMTCTEAMAKGIPMLFAPAIPGQEEENCEYFVQNGFGEVMHSEEVVERWFNQLSSQYKQLEQQRPLRSMLAGHHRYNPEICCRTVAELLSHTVNERPLIAAGRDMSPAT